MVVKSDGVLSMTSHKVLFGPVIILGMVVSSLIALNAQAVPRCEQLFSATSVERVADEKFEQRVMVKALGMHVTEKTLTPELTERAVKALTGVVDPMRMFLLESEYQYLTHLSPEDLTHFHNEMLSPTERKNFGLIAHIPGSRFHAMVQELAKSGAFRNEIMNHRVSPTEEAVLKRADKSHPRTEDEVRARFIAFVANRIDMFMNPKVAHRPDGSPYSRAEALVLALRSLRPWVQETYSMFHPNMLPALIAKAYLRALDAHSDLLLPVEFEGMSAHLAAEMVGIGIVSGMTVAGLHIQQTIPGGGADVAGLKAGDIITHIENQGVFQSTGLRTAEPKAWLLARNLTGQNLSRVTRGAVDSMVRVRVLREGTELERTIQRKAIKSSERMINAKIVKSAAGDIAHIKFGVFYSDSAAQLRQAITEQTRDGKIKGLILDLRGNGGGSLPELQKILGLFIKEGPGVVISDGRNSEVLPILNDNGGPVWTGPLMVMTDYGSASASEGLSGTLQAYGRALVVGESQTYGKGSMQQTFAIGGGLGMKVTAGLFFAPSGKTPQVQGVKSDLVVNEPAAGAATYERELDFVIPPMTLPSLLPSESSMMPNRTALLRELQRRLEARLKATPHAEVNATQDLAAEEALRIMVDYIEINR